MTKTQQSTTAAGKGKQCNRRHDDGNGQLGDGKRQQGKRQHDEMATGNITTAKGSRVSGGMTMATGGTTLTRGSWATGGTTMATGGTTMARG